MTPKMFLRFAGSFLMIFGTLGLIGILGKLSQASFFHPPYWINYFHIIFGFILFFVSLTNYKNLQRILVVFAASIGITIGVVGLVLGGYFADKFALPELKDPSDHLAHLLVGLAAFWTLSQRKS